RWSGYSCSSGSSGNYTQTSGTFTSTPATGTMSCLLSGVFTLSGGTFDAPRDGLTVDGDWTHTAGGTFNHNNGTVTFTGSSRTSDVMGTETFNNLTFTPQNGWTRTIAAGDTLLALGTLTLNNGYAGTGTLEARGNVTIAATFQGGNSPLLFTGSAASG